MPESLVIQSHRGPYSVHFEEGAVGCLCGTAPANAHFIVDSRVAELHLSSLAAAGPPSILYIEAIEAAKALDKVESYVEHFITRKLRRSDVIVAVGGGIIQDITCFLASIMLRGVEWRFYPTTLLAQADSCIGSKSSINVGSKKNIVGTFYPPAGVVIDNSVLSTLDERDVRSGVGEMLKVHAIDAPASFDRIAADYSRLFESESIMKHYVRRSLELKKPLVEDDEFDCGPRNVMNYGHSFGHAIESATGFAVPHGIAVTLGMDMANYISVRRGLAPGDHYRRMHPTLALNFKGFARTEIPPGSFFDALTNDKKNLHGALRLVLPDNTGRITMATCQNDETFRAACIDYLERERIS